MKLLKLTKNEFAMVDDEDFDKLNEFNWSCWNNAGRKVIQKYAIRNRHKHEDGYVMYKRKKIKLHRLLMKIDDPNILVDHIDGNGLNCQKNNLRICNCSENAKNTTPWGKSSYLGVSTTTNGNKWRAYCNQKHLGTFVLEEEAALAYDKAAKELHGEFANLNFK